MLTDVQPLDRRAHERRQQQICQIASADDPISVTRNYQVSLLLTDAATGAVMT